MRTGRASTGMLESVHVEAYGSKMPLNQLASLSIPEPSLIVAQPFDPSLMGAIEKAIRASDLGLNPSNDGKVVRVPIPALTEERRKELVAPRPQAGRGRPQRAASVRRDANERLKKLLKDHTDLRGRRAARPRRSPEDHRRPHQAGRRPAEEEGPGAAGALTSDGLQVRLDSAIAACGLLTPVAQAFRPADDRCPTSPTSSAPARAARGRSTRASGTICAAAAPRCSRVTISSRLAWRSRGQLEGSRADDVALPRAAAALRRRDAGHPRRGLHAAAPREAARRSLGLERLYIKDESLNPTNSFKARGQSTAVTRAKALGAKTLSVPTAGNAGTALAAYAAAAGLEAQVFIPRDVKPPFIAECELYGAGGRRWSTASSPTPGASPPSAAARSAGTTSRR